MIATLALSFALAAAPICIQPPAPDDAVCVTGDEAALLSRISPLLGTIDRPVSVEAWRSLPVGALPLLERIAEDPSSLPSARARALEGAAALGADGAVHERLAADVAAPFAVRHSALRALGRLLPRQRLEAALGRLLSGDPERRIRASAAEVLASASPSTGCGAVRAQAAREGIDGRGAFRRALTACGPR
ncbi:MAG TPA: hypothetical protein VLT61_08295 [Anaeromyxobacteraceae bacterium]|nr:hypothetical protein [Anaeromyxobacteraceae bacterium]